MNKRNRRSFLKTSLLASTSLSALPGFSAENEARPKVASPKARVAGANDDIRYAVVGFNGRGKSHIEDLRGIKGTRLAALCDVDQSVLDRETKICRDRGQQLEGYTDIRKLLENKD